MADENNDNGNTAEGHKPVRTVEVVRVGTDRDAAIAWERAAFREAARANRAHGVLLEIKGKLDAYLSEVRRDADATADEDAAREYVDQDGGTI